MLLEFGSVSNWNALFAGYTMCYLLRVYGILFQSKFILFCMFKKNKKQTKTKKTNKKKKKKKKKKKEEGKKDTWFKKNNEKKRMLGLKE